jgi:integrase
MSKQTNPYFVQPVVLSSGERLPFLCLHATGMPLIPPTVFALASLRATNLATATISQALRAVMVLYLALDDLDIDLDERIYKGRLLDLGEIESLTQLCALPIEHIVKNSTARQSITRSEPIKIDRSKNKSKQAQNFKYVNADTAAIRILYIHRYLKWRATERLLKMNTTRLMEQAFRESFDCSLNALFARIKTNRRRNSLNQREGLPESALNVIEEVIAQDSPRNPWVGVHPRARNELIIRILLDLGIRRGELLGIRIQNINFQKDEVLIARQADSPDDPRTIQPNTKTKDRVLPIGDRLSKLLRAYIQGPRRAIKGARKHDFLIVANGSGQPLTNAGANKIFHVLRTKVPGLPEELFPHILRHTWNDSFSALMDSRNITEEREMQMRSRLMGWSETSGTAATYTRRHTKERAREASIKLQNSLKAPTKKKTK